MTSTEKEATLVNHDYVVSPRDFAVRPDFPGAWMITDTIDADGFAIVGDDRDALINEAYTYMDYEES